jgi:hypothetical protein
VRNAGFRPQFSERNACSRPVHIVPGVTGSVIAIAMNGTASPAYGPQSVSEIQFTSVWLIGS